MSIFRLGCLTLSLIAFLPTLLVLLVLAFALVFVGLAPAPVVSLVEAVEQPVMTVVLDNDLKSICGARTSGRLMSARPLLLSPVSSIARYHWRAVLAACALS